MAQPNGLNPDINGPIRGKLVGAGRYGSVTHVKEMVAGNTASADIFGSSVGANAVVTGFTLVSLGGTNAWVTLRGANGLAIASIAKGTTTGAMLGTTTTLSNVTLTPQGSCTIIKSASTAGTGVRVYVNYRLPL